METAGCNCLRLRWQCWKEEWQRGQTCSSCLTASACYDRGGQVLWMPPPPPQVVRSVTGWDATGCPGPPQSSLTESSLCYSDPSHPNSSLQSSVCGQSPSCHSGGGSSAQSSSLCSSSSPWICPPQCGEEKKGEGGLDKVGQQHGSSFGPVTVLELLWTGGETHQDTWTHLWMMSCADYISRRQTPCLSLLSSHTFPLKLPGRSGLQLLAEPSGPIQAQASKHIEEARQMVYHTVTLATSGSQGKEEGC